MKHYDTLKSILVDIGISEDSIVPNASLRKDLKLDSTETVEVALEIKRRLDVDVKLESKADHVVSDVCALIERAKAA